MRDVARTRRIRDHELVGFLALEFDIPAADADAWSDALLAAGALSVDTSDADVDTGDETPLYGEPGSAEVFAWPITCLAALFGPNTDLDDVLATTAQVVGKATPAYRHSVVADQDWVRVTQSQFHPIRIADGFWVVPSWCPIPEPQGINLRLDPGLAFGTGSHPTTRLCLEWLRAHVAGGESLLDYGCGSGILAIAAAKLGAARVVGTDVDPLALAASVDNAQRNDVAATFVLPGVLPVGAFDIVIANILANPLLDLAHGLRARVRIAGKIALAGVLQTQADAVAAAYRGWFNIVIWRCADGWALLSGERTSRPD